MPAKGTDTMTIRYGICIDEKQSECVRCGTPALEPPRYDADALAIEIEGRSTEAIGAEQVLLVRGTDGQNTSLGLALRMMGLCSRSLPEATRLGWRLMRGFALMPGRWQWTVARVADVMCMIASPEPQRVVPSPGRVCRVRIDQRRLPRPHGAFSKISPNQERRSYRLSRFQVRGPISPAYSLEVVSRMVV